MQFQRYDRGQTNTHIDTDAFVCIYVLCFCAATDFSANKDLYRQTDTLITILRSAIGGGVTAGTVPTQTAANGRRFFAVHGNYFGRLTVAAALTLRSARYDTIREAHYFPRRLPSSGPTGMHRGTPHFRLRHVTPFPSLPACPSASHPPPPAEVPTTQEYQLPADGPARRNCAVERGIGGFKWGHGGPCPAHTPPRTWPPASSKTGHVALLECKKTF